MRASWSTVEPAKPLIANWHIDAIAEHLEAVAAGKIRKLVINIAPGTAKSIEASVMFSAWLWTVNPQTRLLCGTYANSLTIRDSIRVRTLLESQWFQETFRPDWKLIKRNEDHLANDKSGFRMALSVDSAATGFRGTGLILDDIMNAKDAHSEAARETARRWVFETMSSRYDDMRTGWRVAIGQRLHESDPYGAMIDAGDELLMLPTEFEVKRRRTTVIGWTDPRKEEGELLFPELFTPVVIAQAKTDLGSYGYSGQHQQRPAPAEGGLYKRDWWRWYKRAELPAMESMCISVDCTFKDAKESDNVGLQVWGFLGPRDYLIDRLPHARMGFTATKTAIRGMMQQHPRAYAVLIEDKANGSAIIEELGREFSGIIAINPEGGKLARAWSTSPDVEAGNVYLPEDMHLISEFVEQHASFPNGAHDDDVDCQTQALNWRKAGAMRMGLAGYLKSEQEREMQSAGLLAKPAIAEQTLRCEKCESISIQTINGMHRCGNCGNQWSKDKAKDESRYRDTRGSLMLK